jgi:YHS domain-containing protein
MDKKAQWALVAAAWFLALSMTALGVLAYRRLGGSGLALTASARPAGPMGMRADGTALCPVTGQVLQVLTSTPKVDYMGTVYYFSGDQDAQGLDARTRFLMDPDKYLKAPAAP